MAQGPPPLKPRRARGTALAAAVVAVAAFVLFHATLLPGMDFGDTPSFQVMGGDAAITPRDAYPLYFALAAPFVRATGDPAHAMNLASAVEGAAASGVVVLAAAELCGAVLPAAATALLLAVSYTFWSQAIITEVYALHILLTALSLLLILRWERRPSLARLAAFFAVFGLSFGNHLATVLLLPGYTVFLLVSAPGGWRTMLAPRIVALAVFFAAVGALQYAWNLHSLWLAPAAPHSMREAIAKFWFDVTKQDWRQTMVASLPRGMAWERLRMYAFDVRQQFGVAGPVLALAGIVTLSRIAPRRALLMALLYIVNVLFALTYSVGDSHVFFLPSHLMIALLCAPAIAWLDHAINGSLRGTSAGTEISADKKAPPYNWASIALLAFVAWLAYDNYPALDRSTDTRPTDAMTRLTADIDDQHAVLLTDLDWQAENGLNYFRREVRRDLAIGYAPDLLDRVDRIAADNRDESRQVLLSDRARADVQAHFGDRFRFSLDARGERPSIAELARDLPPRTRYVLSVLKPARNTALDLSELARTLDLLGATGAEATLGSADYSVIAGMTGSPPLLAFASKDPFRRRVVLEGTGVDIRMESWLAFDTIRRMGFGQVVAAHRHTMIVERGVSFVAFLPDGRPIQQGYASSLFAPEPRWAIVNP